MVFYLVCEHAKGITQMAEILNVDVPKDIGELSCLLQKVDDFKRLYSLRHSHMERRYANTRVLEEDPISTTEMLNPKRHKAKVPSFSLS
jgi:hypothetical protein